MLNDLTDQQLEDIQGGKKGEIFEDNQRALGLSTFRYKFWYMGGGSWWWPFK